MFGGVSYEVNVQTAPDSENVKLVSLGSTQERRSALRHSIYENPECVPAIGKWIPTAFSDIQILHSNGRLDGDG
ncbi:hypothetical protein [Bradyrhizobium sp. CCBAU 51765]|uniref:hypothetical protein n=1 Tax=Bradyrhizobium sp. CCBAU 51765 TaxID=1325102 RepID=UPI0018898F0C|nr:hypothetical protein [Bradyrhizobium sp. CCBAU 51765]